MALIDLPRDGEVEVEELLEEVFAGAEAVGVEDSGVEGGVGVLERVAAGEFERAVEGAKAALHLRQGLGADAADLTAGGGEPVQHGQTSRPALLYFVQSSTCSVGLNARKILPKLPRESCVTRTRL